MERNSGENLPDTVGPELKDMREKLGQTLAAVCVQYDAFIAIEVLKSYLRKEEAAAAETSAEVDRLRAQGSEWVT